MFDFRHKMAMEIGQTSDVGLTVRVRPYDRRSDRKSVRLKNARAVDEGMVCDHQAKTIELINAGIAADTDTIAKLIEA